MHIHAILERVASRFPYAVEDALDRIGIVIAHFGCPDSGFFGEPLQDTLGKSTYEYCLACTRGDQQARDWLRRLQKRLTDCKDSLKKGVAPKEPARKVIKRKPLASPTCPHLKISPNAMRRFKVVHKFCTAAEMQSYVHSFKKLAFTSAL